MNGSVELDQLIELVAPPSTPLGLNRSWAEVETELGLKLPSDYKKFIEQYGDGVIAGAGVDLGYIGIWNWRSTKNALKGITNVIKNYEAERRAGHDFPYDCFPAPGGLLPFGATPNGDHFNWRTEGDPESWDVVFYSFDSAKMILLEGDSFSQALHDILAHDSVLVPSEFGPEIMSPPYRFTEFNW